MKQIKKGLKIIVFFLPFLIGVIGYYGIEKESLTNALYYSMCFYTLSYVTEAPNIVVELARWTAPLMTAGGLVLLVNSLRERIREWAVYLRGGSIAVYGAETEVSPVLSELGSRGIRIRDRLPHAERYILLGEEKENFWFYNKYKKDLLDKKVYLKCASMNGRRTEANLKLFSEEEIGARLFWKKQQMFREAREKKYCLKMVFLEFGALEEQMLLWGLQNNIFHPKQELQYHIFGEAKRFRFVYHELDKVGDRIIFHEEPWYECQELLWEADRIFVSDTSEILSDLLYAVPEKKIHVFAEQEKEIAYYETQSRLEIFYWKREAQKVENILDEVLLLRAKSINLRYAHLYSGIEETKQNMETEWRKLDTFTKYSNISAADYHEVRLKMIDEWKKESGKTEPDEAYLLFLAELEHIRWCRYHYLNNWSYGIPENGKNKDVVRRIHQDLIPFSELTEAEKEKDTENIRVLLSVRMDVG